MGFFGSDPRKRRQMFDPPGDLGPIDPGMSMPDYAGDAAASLPPDAPAPVQKTGFFGAGGVGRGIAGSIGDYLLQMNHMQPIYAPAMEHQRNLQEMQAGKEQDRKAEMDQWVAQQKYKEDHPPTVNNDTVADYNFIAQTLGPDAAKKFLENKTIPPMMGVDVQNPNGSVTREFYPRGGLPGQGSPSGPPPAAVQYLKQHPESAAQFDQKYGQGASQSIMSAGGAGPAAAPSGFLGSKRRY